MDGKVDLEKTTNEIKRKLTKISVYQIELWKYILKDQTG